MQVQVQPCTILLTRPASQMLQQVQGASIPSLPVASHLLQSLLKPRKLRSALSNKDRDKEVTSQFLPAVPRELPRSPPTLAPSLEQRSLLESCPPCDPE